ncbi:MAG: sensor domain-containing diguanylate cyclase [bacterium]|nr:sensor domain-containing diguanylate cyclase [bacterium]
MNVAMNQLSQTMYQELLDHIADGIFFVNTNREIIYWNKSAELITGYSREEIVGKQCSESGLDDIDDAGTKLCDLRCPLLEVANSGRKVVSKVWAKNKDGQRIHLAIRAIPLCNSDNRMIGAVTLFTDQSSLDKLAATENLISELTIRDTLTNVYNRRYISEVLLKQIALKKRGQISFGLIMVDIDRFKRINDTYGEQIGNEILYQIATLLNVSVRLPDLVARWGGEEFLILAYTNSMLGCKQLAERLRQTIELHKFPVEDIIITASFGCTFVKGDDTFEKLISRAEKALLRAKEIGRNRVALFE